MSGVHDKGVCMAGRMCMAGGACMVGGVHGRGHAWQGEGMCGGGHVW